MDMIGEGRYNAAVFLEWVAKHNQEISYKSLKVAKIFEEEAGVTHKMCELMGGWQRNEEQAKKLAEPEVRKGIVKLILEAKCKEANAREGLEDILIHLS
ncbi:MAG: hypothetical protein ACYDEX_26160 [Mobilitalea sp.]